MKFFVDTGRGNVENSRIFSKLKKYYVMEWIIVVVLVLVSIGLLLLEFLVLTGSGVVGILGLAGIAGAVYAAYSWLGVTAGHFTLLGTALLGGIATYYALRARTWRRFRLDSRIDSTVERVDELARVGDSGVCVGRLAPMGKVMVGDNVMEAESVSGFLDEGSPVTVVKVLKNKIVVKLKTE